MSEGRDNGRGANFMSLYLEHTKYMESPTIFHIWVAIACFGHVLGRRVWLSKEGKYALFPGQVMACLVAASGRLRKSTAIGVGKRLLEAAKAKLPGESGIVNIPSDQGSAQSFMEQMRPTDDMGVPLDEADAVAFIVASELGATLSNDKWNASMSTNLTTINDAAVGRFDEETLTFEPSYFKANYVTKAPLVLKNPCIGMIAATTPTGLAKEIPNQAQLGGFFGRVIWVYAQDTDRDPNPMTSLRPRVAGVEDQLVRRLVEAAALAGPVRYAKEAREWYAKWYAGFALDDFRSEGLASGFRERKHDHLLRVAIILAAMDGSVSARSGSIVIQVPHLKMAQRYLDQVERALPKAFIEIGARTQVNLETKILQMLSRHPERWFERHYIVVRMHQFKYNTVDVDRATAQLLQVRYIKRRGDGTQSEYRYRRTSGSMLKLAKEATTEALDAEDPGQ